MRTSLPTSNDRQGGTASITLDGTRRLQKLRLLAIAQMRQLRTLACRHLPDIHEDKLLWLVPTLPSLRRLWLRV